MRLLGQPTSRSSTGNVTTRSGSANGRRNHAEKLRWLGEQTSQHTGVPLTMTTRRSVIMLLTRFINETTAWQWDDVPGRVLFTGATSRRSPRRCRFIPGHELAALMTAVDALTDPYQHAALIVAR